MDGRKKIPSLVEVIQLNIFNFWFDINQGKTFSDSLQTKRLIKK